MIGIGITHLLSNAFKNFMFEQFLFVVFLSYFVLVFRDFYFIAMLDTDQIMPGLYLGGIVSVTDLDCLQKSRITHILTLLDHPLPLELSKHFTYKFLYLLDLCDSDLLNILTGCLQFITNGMQNGGHVFVHW